MAVRLMQAPLPWLPEGAAEIAPGVGLMSGEDGSGTVWVHGMATFCWDAEDEAARKLAAVQLYDLEAATQKQIAAAFGTDPVTVYRWVAACREQGLAGLLPGQRGPKGPSKLTPELTRKIRGLRQEGLSHAAIAARCGVSPFAVRTALGTVGSRAAAAAAGEETAGQEPRADAAGDGWEQEALPEQRELPVLPDPVPRDCERAASRFGLLGEGAVPVFTPGARYPLAGLLLALPALQHTGLLACARTVYGRIRSGFYGLELVLVACVFLALLREPRAEGATRVPPAALGRVLGLDRAPEVKTIRRKLAELATAGKAADLQLAIASHHAATRPDELGLLYIDGHTRAYFGTRDVQKMHLGRLGRPGPGTEETWVTTGKGDPLLVVIAEPSDSLAAQIRAILPDLRKITGEAAKPLLCFDRGGWSPDLFAAITAAGFDLLIYRKAAAGKPVPDISDDLFAAASWTGDDGREREYDLAETPAELPVTAGEHKGEVLDLRQVTRRGKGHQIHLLTSRDAGALPPAAAVYAMTGRWREENYFRYGRAHFGLDALDSYDVTPDDPDRKVPSPAKKTAAAAVKNAKKALAGAQAARQAKLDALRRPAPGTMAVITNTDLAKLDAPVDTARRKLETAQAAQKATPAKIPLGEHNPAMVRLDTETKLITHAIRMAAFNAETTLARALNGSYSRADDEAYALIREAFNASGDIIPGNGTLTIRLDPLSAPRRTQAIAALCDKLNATRSKYPGTDLILRYEIKNHPGTA
jgi:transposase-like protein